MRYVVLRRRTELADVAATWPYGSIERTALWTLEAADLAEAQGFAKHHFPGQQTVVLAFADAEADVHRHLKALRARAAALHGG